MTHQVEDDDEREYWCQYWDDYVDQHFIRDVSHIFASDDSADGDRLHLRAAQRPAPPRPPRRSEPDANSSQFAPTPGTPARVVWERARWGGASVYDAWRAAQLHAGAFGRASGLNPDGSLFEPVKRGS